MQAAVLASLNEDLEIRNDVGLLELAPTDVRVRIVSSGICHSDLSMQNGTIPAPTGLPVVLGHEGAGVVQAVGDAVTRLAPGDHVILSSTPSCGSCRPCLRNQDHLCDQTMPQAETRNFVIDDRPAGALAGLGTFAEEVVLSEAAVVGIDRDVPLGVASLIGCAVTTGVGAAIYGARITPASSVVVFGCGGVGVSAIQGARIAGASEILAVDTLESKLEQAMHFGATRVTTPDGLESARDTITGGEGFDFALECVGNPRTIRAAYDAVRRGGSAVIVGVGRPEEKIELSAYELFYGDKTLRGSMYGSANSRTFMPELISLWKVGKLDLESMIGRRIRLEEINDAFQAMQLGKVIRTVIDF